MVHLHLHTEYSLLDGACRIRDIPGVVRANGHTAVAITDHGAMYGAVEFWRACTAEGINPIIGCEVYVAPGSRFDHSGGRDGNYHHLVLLCENNTGYQNLIYIVSKAFIEGFYSKPRVDLELLASHAEGLIALSACISGEIPSALSSGDRDRARAAAERYAKIFGKDHFYIELQNHGIAEERQVLPALYALAQELDLPVVATNDVHYLNRADYRAQTVLMCIQTNTTVDDINRAGLPTNEFYYKSDEEMEKLFAGFEGALENTDRIAARCHVSFEFGKYQLPSFPVPAGTTAAGVLREKAFAGLDRLAASGRIPAAGHTLEEYLTRAEYELGVIDTMGYNDYFLIVADYVGYAKSVDLPVGPGRGSGCGSLVTFATGITDVDPIRFDLLFERFLNPERVSMPDIDIDFDYVRRDEMLRYVREKYGDDRVAQIITFGTLAARAAIRDSGRALGMSYAEVDEVARLVPRDPEITVADVIELPSVKELCAASEKVRTLLDTAKLLEGMPRNVSVHAAGVVVTGRPVTDYVPLSVSGGAVITQYDMNTVADLGLLKFDFLALRYLTIIRDAETQIREREPEFDLETLGFDDRATYDLISAGQTTGIFQLESAGMRAMLSNLHPDSIDDIIASIALYRPGPMDSIPRYIEGKKHPENVRYAIPCLEPILRSTYGCIVYQEQVMSVFRTVAGYSFGHADVVRRAMSKKKASVLEAEREGFVNGAEERGVSREAAEKLFNDMASFASYAFNKSHAAAYAVLCYRTAYLKAHYPCEYTAALLTSVLGTPEKVAEYISEAAKNGIRVLPPDINRSMRDFHVDGKTITFGLLALKNVGLAFVDSIIRERAHGPFASFADFLDRMSGVSDLNRRALETLIKAGCFDSLGVFRSRLLAALEPSLAAISDKQRNNISGQIDMFSAAAAGGSDAGISALRYPELPEFSPHDLLMLEREVSGMFFSGHLLDSYARHIEALSPIRIAAIAALGASDDGSSDEEEAGDAPITGEVEDGQTVCVCGMVTAMTSKTTKSGDRMAFCTLEDPSASVEVVVFAKKYEKYASLIREDAALCVSGTVSAREGEKAKVLLASAVPLLANAEYDALAAQGKPIPGTRGAESAARSAPSRPAAPGVGREAPRPQTAPGSAAPRPQAKAPAFPGFPASPRVVYIRVPSKASREYRRCANLCEIFDGPVRTVFYFTDTAKYEDYPHGTALTAYVAAELTREAGEGSVVAK